MRRAEPFVKQDHGSAAIVHFKVLVMQVVKIRVVVNELLVAGANRMEARMAESRVQGQSRG